MCWNGLESAEIQSPKWKASRTFLRGIAFIHSIRHFNGQCLPAPHASWCCCILQVENQISPAGGRATVRFALLGELKSFALSFLVEIPGCKSHLPPMTRTLPAPMVLLTSPSGISQMSGRSPRTSLQCTSHSTHTTARICERL